MGRDRRNLLLVAYFAIVASQSTNTSTEQTATTTCADACSRLPELYEEINGKVAVGYESVVDICVAVQGHVNTTRCVIDHGSDVRCTSTLSQLLAIAVNCSEAGVDIKEAPAEAYETDYTASKCVLCSVIKGAVQADAVSDVLIAECEEHCEADDLCAGFDYDAIRKLCRTWKSCHLCSRSMQNQYGCQWQFYERPGAQHYLEFMPTGGCQLGSSGGTRYLTTGPPGTLQNDTDDTDAGTNASVHHAVAVASAHGLHLPVVHGLLAVQCMLIWICIQ